MICELYIKKDKGANEYIYWFDLMALKLHDSANKLYF